MKNCNLPVKKKDSLKMGDSYHQQPVHDDEFGQQCTELKEGSIASISDSWVGVKT